MRRPFILSILLIVALVVPLFASAPVAAADLANAGTKSTFDDSTVGWYETLDGTIVVVSDTGNVTAFKWIDGARVDQWNVALVNTNVTCAAIDNVQQRLAVGTDSGVEVISTGLQDLVYSVSVEEGVDSLDWDGDGDLWVGLSTSNKAEEYQDTTATGSITQSHQFEVSAILGLPDGSVVTTGRDLIISVNHPNGTQDRSLMNITSTVTNLALIEGGSKMIATSEDGQFITYSTESWELVDDEYLSTPGRIHSVITLTNGNIAMGTHNGHLYVLNGTDYSETAHFTGLGNIVGISEASPDSFIIITSFSGSSDLILFDIDTDGDGVVDTDDAFPEDSTQQDDTDGDGYGNNQMGNEPDRWPYDSTQWADSDGDGHGDNPEGTNGDQFPNNPTQYIDSDGDGYGDASLGVNGDAFVTDATQWNDSDGDGLGDNPLGNNPDDCPNSPGDSSEDRNGCPDSDSDGYSDSTDDFPACSSSNPNGGDSEPLDPTQWCDTDQDNYGDNLSGNKPDWCPSEWGNSTRGIYFDTDENRYVTVQRYGCPDQDGDGYEDSGEHDGLTDWSTNSTEWVDSDRDGVGDNSDWDDLDPTVATEEEYCEKNPEDYAVCSTPYTPGDGTQVEQDEMSGSEKRNALIKEFLIYGGGIGVGIIAAILILWGLIGLIRSAASKRSPDAQYSHQDATKELQAWEEGEEFATRGGITQEKGWEDEALGDGVTEDQLWEVDGEGGDGKPSAVPDAKAFVSEAVASGPSVEETPSDAEDDAESEPEPMDEPEPEPEPPKSELPEGAPPLPETGIPSGWTMEQWTYYGHQWWDSQKEKEE